MPDPRSALFVALLAIGTTFAQQPAPAPVPTAPRAVLVTGASSGIGRKTTEVLAANGFFVYAGARKDDDLKQLATIANVQPIRLDVTDAEQIAAAVQTVRTAGRGLFGLVNNAGVAVLGPLLDVTEQDFAQQMQVNVFGPWRVTKAFAPLLIESKGRILTTGSISGTVTWPMGGPYTMSKHAVEAYTDVLAAELRPLGVHVGVVQPGNYRSDIMATMRERLVAGGYADQGSRFQAQIDRLLQQPTDRAEFAEPDAVAAAFLSALTDAVPRRRYLVVPNQREAELTLRAAFTRLVQTNRDQPFAYDRDGLIRLLDDALDAAAAGR
jgi:NAD(P)-dependent dehydrogenase (short-subunit alcohol dehydrogenase family)